MSQQLHFWKKLVLVFLKNLSARLSSANINLWRWSGLKKSHYHLFPHDEESPQILSIFDLSLLN